MNSTVDAANLVAAGTDFSLWGLFVEANFVVKLVMLGLLAASVWVWAVVFEKVVSLRKVNREATTFEDRFWSGGSLDELFDQEGDNPKHPMASVFSAAMNEWRRSKKSAGADIATSSVRERIDRAIGTGHARRKDGQRSDERPAAENTADTRTSAPVAQPRREDRQPHEHAANRQHARRRCGCECIAQRRIPVGRAEEGKKRQGRTA